MAREKKSNISKIAGGGLLVLLIAGLAGFTSGGVGGRLTTIGSVGDTPLDLETYADTLQRQIALQQQQLGRPITGAELQQSGLELQVRRSLIAEAALREETSDLGLSVGDEQVARQIQQIPQFQGIDGQFDREAYQFALERNDLTPAQFEDNLRTDLARDLLQQAVIGGLTVDPTYADTLYNFLGETRSFEWSELTDDILEDPIPEPSAEELAAFHTENAPMFETPEIRKISYAWLTPDMLLEQIEVDDARLREMYDARAAEYVKPERRLVERLGFSDTEAAAAAKAQIEAGESSFEDLVEARGLTLQDVDEGEVSRDDLDPGVADAVFALSEPGLSEPVETPLGPAIYRINAVLQATETPFEDVRDDLLAQDKADTARRRIADQTNGIDDILVGGATLEDLAEDTDMQFGQVDYAEGTSTGLAAYEEFRSYIGGIDTDDFPEIQTLSDGGIFAARLDEIVPPALPPLEDVRDAVISAWTLEQRREMLEARGEALKEALTEGQSFEDVGLTATGETGTSRTDNPDGLPRGLIVRLFEIAEGEVVIASDADTTAIARLTAIAPPDLATEEAEAFVAQLEGQGSQGLAEDVFTIYNQAVLNSHDLSLNQAAIDQVIRQLTGGGSVN